MTGTAARPVLMSRRWGIAVLLSFVSVWILMSSFGWLAIAVASSGGAERVALGLAYLAAGACSGGVALRAGPARRTRIQRCVLAGAAATTWMVAFVLGSSASVLPPMRMDVAGSLLRDLAPVVVGALLVGLLLRPDDQRSASSARS